MDSRMFDFHHGRDPVPELAQSRSAAAIENSSEVEDHFSLGNSPPLSYNRYRRNRWFQSPESQLSTNPSGTMSLFKTPAGKSVAFETAPSKPYTFQTAPSRPGQKVQRGAEQSALRRLFEKNGIISPLGDKFTTLCGEDYESSRSDGTERSNRLEYDGNATWNGFQDENDWCGSGMHVDFRRGDQVQLESLDEIVGQGATAVVDLVRCRGIRLARKTVLLRRNLTIKDVLTEVRALHELRHAHIIRLVGTYTQGKRFSMLLYPVARLNLAEFLDTFQAPKTHRSTEVMLPSHKFWKAQLSPSSVCLISALRAIHKQGIKHMDIKPQNVLLKWLPPSQLPETWEYRVFLCDFGISHIFEANNISQTSSFFGRTPRYSAPEVATDNSHGRAADIFSLGCVLAEMNTVYSGFRLDAFNACRHEGTSALLMDKQRQTPVLPYNETIVPSQAWVRGLNNMEISTEIIALMLEKDPVKRPRLFREREKIQSVDRQSTSEVGSGDLPDHVAILEDGVITASCPHDAAGPEPYVYDTKEQVDLDSPESHSQFTQAANYRGW